MKTTFPKSRPFSLSLVLLLAAAGGCVMVPDANEPPPATKAEVQYLRDEMRRMNDRLQASEAQYGDIPEGAFVALRTDWYKNWPDMNAMSGTAEDGSENFPGWSLEAIKYIYEERHAAANGHETLDTDGSAECAKHGDLACERYVLDNDKIQIELLRNLDKLPAAGAVLFAAWPNFKGANGLPCRVWAVFA